MALNYLLNEIGSAYSVVSNSCTAGSIIIPNMYNGLPVKGIEESAFLNCNSITNVTIPSSIEYIGYSAFENCSNLAILNFSTPNSQLFIGTSAFKNCGALTSIILPSNIVLDGSFIFQNCIGLVNINLPNNLASIPLGCFLGCTSLSSINLPDGLNSIGGVSFKSCPLVNIFLPNSINNIGPGAFQETNLVEVTMPDPLTNFSSISSCLNLKKITLGSKIDVLKEDSFFNCPNLTKVYFKGNQPAYLSLGSPNFNVSNLNLKFYRRKNFVTGWGSVYGGIPVVLWSDNTIKSGGTGRITLFKNPASSPPSPYDPDALIYINSIEAADSQTLEENVKQTIDSFVIGCKTDGIWNAIKSCCILAGARTLAGALVPLKGVAPTNNNFIPADYDRKTGLKGNGSTKYLNSNRADNSDPQDNQHVSIYHTDFSAYNNAVQYLLGSNNSSNTSSSVWIAGTSQYAVSSRRYDSAAGSNNFNDGAIKFKGVTRENSNEYIYYLNSFSFSTVPGASSSIPGNQNIFIFARNNVNTPTNYSLARISFYSVGEHLNIEKLAIRVENYMSTLSNLNLS